MTDDDPTDERIKAEIAAAVKILKEDGIHVRRHVQSLIKEFMQPKEEETEGKPPPAKDPKKPANAGKMSRLWGDLGDE